MLEKCHKPIVNLSDKCSMVIYLDGREFKALYKKNDQHFSNFALSFPVDLT